MAFENLGEFLNLLADRGELTRVSAAVDARLELAAIVRRIRESGPVLLFDQVTTAGGSAQSIPVAANIFGTESRLLTALGANSLSDITERVNALTKPGHPGNWLEAIQQVPLVAEASRWPVRNTGTAMSQQVVLLGSDVDLTQLPIPVCWPDEKLPSLNSAQIYIEAPWDDVPAGATTTNSDASTDDGNGPVVCRRRIASRVPVQVRDHNTVYLHWTPHDEAWRTLAGFRQRGQQMPVAIVLGGDPVLTYTASVPLPPHVDPLVFAGFLRQESVTVSPGRSVDISIPSGAELILEGLIDPEAAFHEAPPIGLSTGSYSTHREVPVATVTAVTHRANPILPVLVPGRSPAEEDWLTRGTEQIFLPLIRLTLPEVVDVAIPRSGAGRHFAFVSLHKHYPQQARKVMHGLWGMTRLSTVKMLIAVDADVDVHDTEAVWFAVGTNTHPGRDTLFSEGPADWHDHAAPMAGVGHRIGIDATRKCAAEGHPREWPESLQVDEPTRTKVNARWDEYGI
ncbi:MAG: UbiD family decarboxylase [Planctomycetaceae bacterium]